MLRMTINLGKTSHATDFKSVKVTKKSFQVRLISWEYTPDSANGLGWEDELIVNVCNSFFKEKCKTSTDTVNKWKSITIRYQNLLPLGKL